MYSIANCPICGESSVQQADLWKRRCPHCKCKAWSDSHLVATVEEGKELQRRRVVDTLYILNDIMNRINSAPVIEMSLKDTETLMLMAKRLNIHLSVLKETHEPT